MNVAVDAVIAGSRALALNARTVESVLKDTMLLKESRVIQLGKDGGFSQATKDFNGLTRGAKVSERGNGLQTATLKDGTKLTVRSTSSGGSPTLEIRPTNGRTIKIRYFSK